MKFFKISIPSIVLIMALYVGVFAQSASDPNGVYRIKEITDSFSRYDKAKTKISYRHVFDYDKQGRPLSHVLEYYNNGKLASSAKMIHAYDQNGRLISKTGDKQNYRYYYDKNGRLNKTTLHIDGIRGVVEETFLEEKKNENGIRLLLFTMNKRKVAGARKDSVDNYCKIEYAINAGNNITKSTVYVYNFLKLKSPKIYSYQYDDKPNPLQQIFIERWFELDLENRGLTNLKTKKLGDKIVYSRMYEYNEFGYPVKCTINKRRTIAYRYERIEVPASVASEPSTTLNNKILVSMYPNPATTELTFTAEGIGSGKAELNIFDLNGRVIRKVSYAVDNRLEALIPLGGIAPGFYVVELSGPKIKERRKLIIQ